MFDISKESLVKGLTSFSKKNFLILLLLFGFGEWFLSDITNFAGGSIGFFVLCFGGYFYLKSDNPKFQEPNDLNGWINLCNEDLHFYEEIEESNNLKKQNSRREESLRLILNRSEKEKIYFIGKNSHNKNESIFKDYFREDKFDLNFYEKFPKYDSSEVIPSDVLDSDAILYFIDLPLSANDLLWLEKFPKNMPIWLVALVNEASESTIQIKELKSQISSQYINKIITLNTNNDQLVKIPFSLRAFFINTNKNIETTKKRLLKDLHSNWQAEIESIRRIQLKRVQRKNQILVASSVFLSPIPSIDVLSMTVLNSLMIKEIKSIWGCTWSPEILDKVSREIIKIAIAQGVIEWSGQTLIGITKWHGPNWLISGTYQAVSAAYLTRVFSSSLADFMAITKGVKEPDLEFIKKNSESIVEKAFEKEKINWKLFINDFKRPFLRLTYTS